MNSNYGKSKSNFDFDLGLEVHKMFDSDISNCKLWDYRRRQVSIYATGYHQDLQ
jgi:hypothetical protein